MLEQAFVRPAMPHLDALKLKALEVTSDAVVITDRDGTVIWANAAIEALTGYAPEELIGETPRKLKSGAQSPEVYTELWETVLSGEVWTGRLINKRKDGALYYEDMTINPMVDEDGEITHFAAIKRDVSCLVRAERARDKLLTMSHKIRESVRDSFEVAFNALADMVDLVDPDLGQHGRRVGELACRMAVYLNLNVDEVREIRLTGMIHDLGKMASHHGSREGRHVHALRTAGILEAVSAPAKIREAICHQEERYDGSGQPDGLKGLTIPLGSRIVAIASAYDQSRHVLKRPLSHALSSLESRRGTYYDPRLLDILRQVAEDDDGAQAHEGMLVSTMSLAPGMTLASNLSSGKGALLYPSGTVLSTSASQKLDRLSKSKGLQPFVRVLPRRGSRIPRGTA
ncbi:MAG: PAS domain S-box protein [Rhodothermales bacterium]|nr:PAS domain S-box protein [Rhodothermales bacterium]